jgi:hypothetical protein
MIDRRRAARWQVDREAQIRVGDWEEYVPCRVCDLGFRGFKLFLAKELEKDRYLNISLAFAGSLVLNIEAWVVWHKTIESSHLYGLYLCKFRDADKERVYQFLQRQHPELIRQQLWQSEKGGAKMEDRRIFQRFDIRLPLRFIEPATGKEIMAKAVDVSAKGLGMLSPVGMEKNVPLEMWLDIPDKGEPLYTRGRVAWKQPSGLREYHFGIELEKADLMGLSRALRV